MASRLTVVLAQTPHAGSQQRACEESLLPPLLTEPQLELTIIPHLEQLQPGDTGTLCLQGIRGPMLLLSWLAPARAHAELQRCGIEGRRAPHELDPEASAIDTGERPIYFVDLHSCRVPESVVNLSRRLRDALQVRTVPIASLLKGLSSAPPAPPVPAPVPVPPSPPPLSNEASLSSASKSPLPPNSDTSVDESIAKMSHPRLQATHHSNQDDSERLNALLDELDRFD